MILITSSEDPTLISPSQSDPIPVKTKINFIELFNYEHKLWIHYFPFIFFCIVINKDPKSKYCTLVISNLGVKTDFTV